jgi:predicted Zn-ribbon and HTH transcriptional regulator
MNAPADREVALNEALELLDEAQGEACCFRCGWAWEYQSGVLCPRCDSDWILVPE